jgi:hypothetical protein
MGWGLYINQFTPTITTSFQNKKNIEKVSQPILLQISKVIWGGGLLLVELPPQLV